jgi:hypothetical protein
MTWAVKRCFTDYDEEWKINVSSHDTEELAEEAAESLRNRSSGFNEWYEVDKD